MTTEPITLTKKDFQSDQEVRWCPGCGDYAILSAVQSVFPDLGIARENFVVVSGIGCSSRFPYYMDTFGFHSIHGRAPAIASGIKVARPELEVWVATGDGDALSIGGNHLIHLLRRNLGVKVVMFNNRIYGLTKGQYSPTSKRGTRSPSTPQGSVESPVLPAMVALGARARFVARTVDTQLPHLVETLKQAHAHTGASFVEVYQNCVVFNDGAHAAFTDKVTAPDAQLFLEHGKPLVFGRERARGLRLTPGRLELEIVALGAGGASESDLLVHDERNRSLAMLLAQMEPPEFPVALGVLYRDPQPSYEAAVLEQAAQAGARPSREADIATLITGGRTWKVE